MLGCMAGFEAEEEENNLEVGRPQRRPHKEKPRAACPFNATGAKLASACLAILALKPARALWLSYMKACKGLSEQR